MKTKIPGSRIKEQAIKSEHLHPDLRIPEEKLGLVNATHPHTNKGALDALRYTGSNEVVDIKLLEILGAEIFSARRSGLNLGNTIDLKADKDLVDQIQVILSDATGEATSLKAAIQAYGALIDERLSNHIGATGHDVIDAMYADYNAAKNGYPTLLAYIQSIASEGIPNPEGDVIVNVLKPWTYEFTVVDPTDRVIVLPKPYTPAANTLEVFEGPLRMATGLSGDYLESTTTSITFNYDLPVGTVVRFRGVENSTLFEWQQEFLTSYGQREFGLISSFDVGQQQLMVFEDGLLVGEGSDYIETNSSLITFTMDLPANAKVIVCKRR